MANKKCGAPIELDEQKRLMVDILDYVHKFCKKNGITYFVVSGTLIGAVRHKGFIPWDDDVDIAMPRKDYDRFMQLFAQEKGMPYRLECLETDSRYYLPFAKVIDTRTVLREHVRGACDIGVFIDVFPVDYISEETKKDAKKIFRLAPLQRIVLRKSVFISRNRSFKQNLITLVTRTFCHISLRSMAKILRKREKYAEKNETPWMLCLYGTAGARAVAPADYLKEFIEMPFENITVMAPKRYDVYLRNLFGDYMVLPPEEKRVSHHGYSVYWKEENG